MTNVYSDLESEIGPEPVRAKKVNGGNGHSGESWFNTVNEISIFEVMPWLNIEYEQHGERIYAKCPSCGNGGERSDVVVLGNALKCPHKSCENSGPSSAPGLRTVVDLTMLVHGVDKLAAVNMLAERFGIELPKSKKANDDWQNSTPSDDDAPDAPPKPDNVKEEHREQQAAEDKEAGPFKGLSRLRSSGLCGYDALIRATSEPVPWLWDGLVTAEHSTEISGPSGHGKTTLMALIAMAFANPSNEPVALLGREIIPVAVDKFVLVIEQENGAHSMRSKFEVACDALELPRRETIDRVFSIIRGSVRVGDPVWKEVVEAGKRGLWGSIFIDSRARVLRVGGDTSNSEDAQAAVADELTKLIGLSNAPAFVISHTKKSAEGNSIEDVSGSAQRGAGSDNVILVRATQDPNTLRVTSTTVRAVKLRDSDEYPEPYTFTLARDCDDVWRLSGSSSIPDVTFKDGPPEVRITRALEAHKSLTKNQLRPLTGLNKDQIEGAISTLFAALKLTSIPKVYKGKSYTAFMLRTEI